MLTIAELANFSTYAVFRRFCLVCKTLDSKAVCVELVASKPQSQTLAPECYVMVNRSCKWHHQISTSKLHRIMQKLPAVHFLFLFTWHLYIVGFPNQRLTTEYRAVSHLDLKMYRLYVNDPFSVSYTTEPA